MKELVEYISKYIVTNPQAVHAREVEIDDRNINIELTVAEEDLGRIIGRHGKVAQNIRTIIKAISLKKGKYYNLKIIEND